MLFRTGNFRFPVRQKYVICGVIFLFILDYFGVFTHLFEIEFDENFRYPYDGDINEFVQRLQQGLKPDMEPINVYNHSYISTCSMKCNSDEKLRLVYLVKSSIYNVDRRQAIRNTWGFEKRFSDVPIRTVFFLGVSPHDPSIQQLVKEEQEQFNDIVQINFTDSYFNNTIKTMSAFKWVTEFCPEAQFYFFSDDDMYISTKNILRFLRNPTNYPDYLQVPILPDEPASDTPENLAKLKHKQAMQYELPPDVILFAGYVFVSSPHRHKPSKWYISLREYPYSLWPPYVTAGAYVLSKDALFKMYYTSFYTKHFKFDDVYLGLVALKAGIEPFHCDEFHFYKKPYSNYNYKYVIASHGYDNIDELQKVWNEQKAAGNA